MKLKTLIDFHTLKSFYNISDVIRFSKSSEIQYLYVLLPNRTTIAIMTYLKLFGEIEIYRSHNHINIKHIPFIKS